MRRIATVENRSAWCQLTECSSTAVEVIYRRSRSSTSVPRKQHSRKDRKHPGRRYNERPFGCSSRSRRLFLYLIRPRNFESAGPCQPVTQMSRVRAPSSPTHSNGHSSSLLTREDEPRLRRTLACLHRLDERVRQRNGAFLLILRNETEVEPLFDGVGLAGEREIRPGHVLDFTVAGTDQQKVFSSGDVWPKW